MNQQEEHYQDEASLQDYINEAYASTEIDGVYELWCDHKNWHLDKGLDAGTYDDFKKHLEAPCEENEDLLMMGQLENDPTEYNELPF